MSRTPGKPAKRITHNGMSMTAKEWGDHLGITRDRVYQRLKEWPLEVALSRDNQRYHNFTKGPRTSLTMLEQA